jgi:hypothetical protein
MKVSQYGQFQELWKFQVQSQKPSSAMMKLALMRTATGMEDTELRKCSPKDTNKKKRLAWAKKHKQWTLDRWKFVLWCGVQIGDFWFQPLHLCQTWREWTNDLRMCISNLNGGWVVMVWGCFADDTVCDLFWIQGTLNQHGYHIILQW